MVSVSWCFTLNNPTDDEIRFFENIEVNRIVVGDETGAEGTRHLQGFVTFKRAHRLTALKKLSARAHWEPAKAADAANYCMKEKILINKDNRKESTEQIKEMHAAIQAGASLKEIADQFTGYYYRYKRVIMEEIAQVKRAKTEILYNQFNEAFVDLNEHPVVLIIGKSGVGKTAFAKAHFTNPLFVSHIDDLKHFSDAHDGIVFDDMDFKHWPVTSQIHITDYEEGRSINVKHSTAYIPPKTRRIFTCNDVPFTSHPAIERRVHRIEFYHNLF